MSQLFWSREWRYLQTAWSSREYQSMFQSRKESDLERLKPTCPASASDDEPRPHSYTSVLTSSAMMPAPRPKDRIAKVRRDPASPESMSIQIFSHSESKMPIEQRTGAAEESFVENELVSHELHRG